LDLIWGFLNDLVYNKLKRVDLKDIAVLKKYITAFFIYPMQYFLRFDVAVSLF